MKEIIKVLRTPIYNTIDFIVIVAISLFLNLFLSLAIDKAIHPKVVENIPMDELKIENLENVKKEETAEVKDIVYTNIEKLDTMPEIEMEEYSLTDEEINLIALITMAEAEGEPEEGQRLVIDTILNRVDGSHWPNNVEGVIYQRNQFSCVWNGRAERCYVKPELVELVKEELKNRTNSEVVFFRTTRYSDYGVPMFKVGHHFFSSYD